MLDIIII